jgi:large subunit ribosomal protein L21
MSFAIIHTGGKQYKVEEGDTITIEKLGGEFVVGDTVTFSDVLLRDDGTETELGTPLVSGAKVSGVLEEDGRAKKVTVIKYRAKSNYFKKRGHRQPFNKVRITSIV